jgi:phenylalanyl-tRNA synthetase beta chain
MNILIPHTWLLEYLQTDATPQEIQKYLSLSGPSIERIYEIEGESVYDIEVTTNRVDSMSVIGIAREAAVILNQAGIPARVKEPNYSHLLGSIPKSEKPLTLPRIENDPSLCRRILCLALANVNHDPAPEFMQKRLRQIGMSTHDAIIDITNYVTHELGHPCHAFDYDKIMSLGGLIIVKRAEAGKTFVTLDDMKYETVGGEVVFENQDGKIIDLPDIKGTANTAIDDSTKNVLFWIESVQPKLVRFASMTHAIRTVAAQVSEKDVDPETALAVFMKGTKLLSEYAGAHIASNLHDEFPGKRTPKTVEISISRVKEYLGLNLELSQVRSILEELGMSVKQKGKHLMVTPPTYRKDIEIPEDIIEEVARIYGYHNIPSTLMSGAIPTNRPSDTNFDAEYEAKVLLSSLGAYEVYTYSLVSESFAKQEIPSYSDVDTSHVKLKNPLTEDMVYLRRELWPSHVKILTEHKEKKEVTLFELANTYVPSQEPLPYEELHLTITSSKDERTTKGMVNALCKHFYMAVPIYEVDPNKRVSITSNGAKIGSLIFNHSNGKMITIIDIHWGSFLMNIRKYPMYTPAPKLSAIIEDFTFSLPEKAYVQSVMETIKETNKLVNRVELKDMFKNRATFTVYYQPEKEMNAQDVAPIRKHIVEQVNQKHQATLVGQL